MIVADFYPRPPRGGRHSIRSHRQRVDAISIHALREEGDDQCDGEIYRIEKFLSTPSARRATDNKTHIFSMAIISIHALREEGDKIDCATCIGLSIFLSTPSARRATQPAGILQNHRCDFYPRPPRGGRHKELYPGQPRQPISIHALREEGDSGCKMALSQKGISIHALREEGDLLQGFQHPHIPISIHALREEGDLIPFRCAATRPRFLSTPSARRATWAVLQNKKTPGVFLSTPSARRATCISRCL